MAGRPHFPLPKGYFGPVVLTKEQEERYREIVRRRLQSALAEEHEFAVVRKRQVDASKWKLYKSKDQLHTYKRRAKAAVLGDAKLGSMLCIGRIEGSLEDMVYGMYDKSHDEMKISMNSGRMFSSLRVCRVCGATVCAKCRLKKFLFAGRQHAIVNVAVCPPCVLTAKTMSVRPAEAAFSILGEKHLPDELVRADTPSETTSDTPDAPTPRDSDGDGGYTMSVSSEMSEDDMEGVIEAMMKHKLHSSRGVASDQRSVLFETGEPTPHSHVPRYEPGAPGLPSEFEFRNLHQPQYSQHQPHYAYAQPQQPLHPADPQFVPANEFVGLNQQQYYEYQSTLPPRPGGADFRSPNEYQRHPGAEGAPHVQYASSRGPGAVPLSAQQMPPMAPMPSTALEYHYTQGVSQQQAAMGPQPAGMAPHQAELFHKMVALQNSAQHVYQITKANEEYMRNLHGPERN
ncbi:hypothetical protein PybrP1_006598 [[Pythium] brassicae (nom. inval.)]|nr:hypothetical protein PybrP1_006598 [[Pythium] brassicae (nom. inval.)]